MPIGRETYIPTRSNPEYFKALGNALKNIFRVTPGGVLVFFPSYKLLKSCIEEWKKPEQASVSHRCENTSFYSSLNDRKQIFTEEPKSSGDLNLRKVEDFDRKIQMYNARITSHDNAALFAVCRGKASEGIDFSDSRARAVVIIGIPYPNFMEQRIKLKRAFLDSGKGGAIKGQEWYTVQAMRAVNQAIGRVIRHRNDFGAVVLLDQRFQERQSDLPHWIKHGVKIFDSIGSCTQELKEFFSNVRLDL